MKRRMLLALGIGVATSYASAQSSSRIGYLWLGREGSDTTTKDGLLKGLTDRGYVPGRNLVIDWRYADGDQERLESMLTELLAAKPALLVTPGVVVTRVAMKATNRVPIVSVTTDPIGAGFADTLARPGHNVTGLAVTAGADVAEKWLEFARDLVPDLARVSVLLNPSSWASQAYAEHIQPVARRMSITLTQHGVRNQQELETALQSVEGAQPQVLIVDSDALLYANNRQIVLFANERRLPAVYALREFVDNGGLLSYGASIYDLWRRAGGHIERILKGADPATIPIEQPVKFELVINQKTARAMGVAMPRDLLSRADQVLD